MKELKGISASSGVAVAKAFLFIDDENPEIPRFGINEHDLEREWVRFEYAATRAEGDVQELFDRANREMGSDHAKIFEAHLMMLADVDLRDQIRARLEESLLNIEWVVWDITSELIQRMSSAPDAYLRERAIDIHDISRRIINHLLKRQRMSLADLRQDVILVTHNLLPSDALTMNKDHVKGIVMDVGGRTSHTAILARAFEIPAVLGVNGATLEIANGERLIVDGVAGKVIVQPEDEQIERYARMSISIREAAETLLLDKDLPAQTNDGHTVALKANIEIPEEVEQALRYGAEGIGLYRSEFLFLTPGQIADEEEQYEAYSHVVKAMGDRPVTIRTLDVGGDKIIPDLQGSGEINPLLGWRAIRFCLAHKELFKTQLRALLRSSAHGNLHIMFPMISGMEELEDALALLEVAKEECRDRKQDFNPDLPVGIMIEVPSAAMTADILARKSAFFSIGTNDLVQYSIAADRGNEQVAYLAQPFHPAVLRFIKNTIDAAHANNLKAAMCGEMAGDTLALPIPFGSRFR
jgi:phosphoenolpyruvate-protein phosphotransferase (PTS system enzyme I)